MATPHAPRLTGRLHLHRRTGGASAGTAVLTAASAREIAVAGLRVVLGFVFLWAFLDKTFGLGYATRSGKGWIDGGSPTKGFLSHVDAGPMAGTLRGWAGETWADWLFMAGLLGIGLALILGIGMRIAAASGTAMMALMWIAEWPPAKHVESGAASGSTNPFADYHVVYALALIALAAVASRSRYGLGARWAELPVVRRNPWLR
ncbi:DoxX family membrane protein [Yinghuangia seranimata]|uniref:DoxX family membrane protein n=1 Tax=Yinghuangia seranimata TaxID=408067 RepID=UPI00248BF425|nr:DoxX family membrane protein [Yinghuangia seranimata]MDI2125437.1 DoxX family membrane protein [Yinghuangia seranimata]